MSDCFSFRFHESVQQTRKSLVLFFTAVISVDVIIRIIKKDVTDNLAPGNVYLIGPQPLYGEFKSYLKDNSFVSEFKSYVGEPNEKLKFIAFDTDGALIADNGNKLEGEIILRLIHAGMIKIFKKRQGVITSSQSYHFVKPSGDHCDKFIRASNLLTSSVEVAFLALALLPHLTKNITRIYVDTSSISYLISMAVLLSEKFSKKLPIIESFESYAVFNQKFDFVSGPDSLAIISATTSGSLVKSLLRDGCFQKEQILTLFHLNLPKDQIGIFDIANATPTGIASEKPKNCALCKKGSRLIRIGGDQFLPETPRHELLMIKKTDFSKARENFFRDFATRNILGWNRLPEKQSDTPEHFYIDLTKIFPIKKFNKEKTNSNAFLDDFEKKLRRHLTRDIETVIYLNDDGSRALANEIKTHLGVDVKKQQWKSLAEVDESALKDSASAFVVAGAITSGRKLLDASRKLRSIHKSASITYFVGFSKLPTDEAFDQLSKDLCQGGHEFVVLRKCPMPRIKEYTKTAWEAESEKLDHYSGDDPFVPLGEPLPVVLKARRDFFMQRENNNNKLFLPSATQKPMQLRNTFAFWADLLLDCKKASQADVYWTIHAILHDLRTKSNETALASTYHTTLLSPACFDRYNDGVIQACLLRAAYPTEMNYAINTDYSRLMCDVVISIVNDWDKPQGEAVLEFLLAIWLERLQLASEHIAEIKKLDSGTMPKDLRYLLNGIAVPVPIIAITDNESPDSEES